MMTPRRTSTDSRRKRFGAAALVTAAASRTDTPICEPGVMCCITPILRRKWPQQVRGPPGGHRRLAALGHPPGTSILPEKTLFCPFASKVGAVDHAHGQ